MALRDASVRTRKIALRSIAVGFVLGIIAASALAFWLVVIAVSGVWWTLVPAAMLGYFVYLFFEVAVFSVLIAFAPGGWDQNPSEKISE